MSMRTATGVSRQMLIRQLLTSDGVTLNALTNAIRGLIREPTHCPKKEGRGRDLASESLPQYAIIEMKRNRNTLVPRKDMRAHSPETTNRGVLTLLGASAGALAELTRSKQMLTELRDARSD